MALRTPAIPNHRERSALQRTKHGDWVVLKDLYPAGEGTIASLIRKGWIERRIGQLRPNSCASRMPVARQPRYPEAKLQTSNASFTGTRV
jgi:hypothetical protein